MEQKCKKWILFLKITGILVILCMIAGACILYAAENHIQLLKTTFQMKSGSQAVNGSGSRYFP